MDKLTMAHEWAIELLRAGDHSDDVVSCAWKYVDAMQAEADKRKPSGLPDVLLTKDKDENCLHFHHEFGHKKCMDCGASLEGWQPDWSQAPEWARWLAMDADGECYWFENKPDLMSATWLRYDSSNVELATSFNYQGKWQDSLRERPHGF